MAVDDKTKGSSKIAESKFLRIFLILASVLLIFVGSTYIPYLMIHTFNLDYAVSMLTGLAFFVIGVVILVFLARKKIIT